MSDTTSPILSSLADGILQLSFNRPARRNALNGEMYLQLTEAIGAAIDDPAVKVIFLQGSQGVFTAGNDLGDFSPLPDELLAMRLFRVLAGCFKPVVAAVEGLAIGIGSTLLGHCDFAFAGASTRFATPFVKLGVCAEGASSLLLPASAGYKKAASILLLGDPFTAAEALAAGLLTEVVEDGQAAAHGLAVAARLAAQPPEVIQTGKRLLKTPQLDAVREAFAREEAAFLRLLAAEPAQTAIAGFLAPKKS
ncbi:MAG: enoyl-CoA hydratase-related protein [Azonexus sp.]|nr:enoyl-CoA hydratase-related protein [Azonexus sp.]MCK6412827.1 enoyl-CoA hydratase-related protein [Azonexus sp.]